MYTRTLFSKSSCMFILIAALTLTAISVGCTQQSGAPASGPVIVQKSDPSHITVAFIGGAGMENLVELEILVTDSNGKTMTRSLGSRLATTPVQTNGSATFTGSFTNPAHIVAIGHFSDGSQKVLLDTKL
jgi:hypothetical protein